MMTHVTYIVQRGLYLARRPHFPTWWLNDKVCLQDTPTNLYNQLAFIYYRALNTEGNRSSDIVSKISGVLRFITTLPSVCVRACARVRCLR